MKLPRTMQNKVYEQYKNKPTRFPKGNRQKHRQLPLRQEDSLYTSSIIAEDTLEHRRPYEPDPPPNTTNTTESASTRVIKTNPKIKPRYELKHNQFMEPKPNSATYSTLSPI